MPENVGRDLRRAVGTYLCGSPAETQSSQCGSSAEGGLATKRMLEHWAGETGSEDAWRLPGLFVFVARWGQWRRDARGECASVCVRLAEDGRYRCTCVGSNVHQDNHLHERATVRQHAGVLDAVVDEISASLGVPSNLTKKHLRKRVFMDLGADSSAETPEGQCFHVVGALYAAISP